MPLPNRARSRAVLIGTSVYQDSGLSDLPSVSNNLADLKAALTDPATGGFTHCAVLENWSDPARVARELSEIAGQAEDVLLIYFAGHGVLGTRQHELFLALAGTDLTRPRYSALPFEWVRDELLESTAATRILILDCCYSGRAIEDAMADHEGTVMGQVSVRGTYTMTSSSSNVPSLAPVGARHTAFSGELLALLREGVPAGPEELDLHLLYRHLSLRMRERGLPAPKQRGTDNVHELALSLNPSFSTSRPVPRAEPEKPAEGADQAALTEARRDLARAIRALAVKREQRAPSPAPAKPAPRAPRVTARLPTPVSTGPAPKAVPSHRKQPQAKRGKGSVLLDVFAYTLTFIMFAIILTSPLLSLVLGVAVSHVDELKELQAGNYVALVVSTLLVVVIATGTVAMYRSVFLGDAGTPTTRRVTTLLLIADGIALVIGLWFSGFIWTWPRELGIGLIEALAGRFS
ncbi:hypothetical protein Acsp05_35170 [Actinokineospora sp. NBRC 105648]|nr:caspase family protein [Actinokineospora sp. NBRC 105648]GLZ39893.1 hypothetical protein Acsp05_35170 [Actinokineospora sp. NBRC 105648]